MNTARRLFVPALLLACGMALCRAAEWGAVDTNFNAQIAPSPGGYIRALVARSNGGVVVGGQLNLVNSQRTHGLAFLEANGSLATNASSPLVLQSVVYSMAGTGDGGLLMGGALYGSDAKRLPGLVKLLPSGGLDTNFHSSFAFDQVPFQISLRADGRTLVVSGGVGRRDRLIQLMADGSPDPAFQPPTNLFLQNFEGFPLWPLTNGQTLTFGSLSGTSFFDHQRSGIYRLLEDGSVDETFPATNYGAAYAFACFEDGRILVGGSSFSPSTNVFSNALTLLLPDGAVDTNFICPIGGNSRIFAVVPRSQQTALVAGLLNSTNGLPLPGVVEIDAAGSILTNFQSGLQRISVAKRLALEPDGSIIVEGYSNSVYFLEKLLLGGAADTNFSTQIAAYRIVGLSRRMLDGGWLILDEIGQPLRRILDDGTADPAFTLEVYDSFPIIATAVVQPDGKAVALGLLTTRSGDPANLVRFNADGSQDTNFVAEYYGGFSPNLREPITILSVAGDGTIIVSGGRFYVSWPGGGIVDVPVFRLLTNGDADETFDPSKVFHRTSLGGAHLLQPDGKVLLSGELLATNQSPMPALVRLLSNGALDPTFSYGPEPMLYRALLALDSSGRILLGEPINTNAPAPLVRLLSNGSPDTSFQPAIGTNSTVNTALVQSDGRILIGGRLFTTDETYLSSVARLEPDGTLDETFFFESETNAAVLPLALMPEGNVMVGGMFGLAGGFERMAFVRLISTERPRLASVLSSNQTLLKLSGNTGRSYRIEHSADLTNWLTLTTELCTNGITTINDPAAATATNRFYRAVLAPAN